MDYLIFISDMSDEHYFILFVIKNNVHNYCYFFFFFRTAYYSISISLVSFIKYNDIGTMRTHLTTIILKCLHVYIMRICFNNAINYNLLTR